MPDKSTAILHQSTILVSLNNQKTDASTSGGRSRKRTLTLVNGGKVDLEQPINPPSAEVIEAMRLRILELEDQLSAHPPAKRAKTGTTGEASSSNAGSSGAMDKADQKRAVALSKAEEKKTKMQLKKIFDRLKKECKSPTCKFQGSSKTIKFDEVLEKSEFDTLFMGGVGTVIQPTPQNKPTSTVTIIRFHGAAQLEALFGGELKPLKGEKWSIGGGPSFAKSLKLGACDVDIDDLEISYSKNTMKATLKFEVSEVGGAARDFYGGMFNFHF
ncbi:hypothetical protein BS47DRAFT_1339244 [Hydnum rufescens UP504]|uniref:Uncharacterized protein n=1 Tax=Hydnum rufescens UP504 TaxID=1448309 RepID=A0A9P6DWQ9_9AGAM|nr:hypothetical protein BS47DRAFT_1339244 [Hydnum rufescens UP504]